MEQHGLTLAITHRLSAQAGSDKLLPRLAENQALINATCRLLTEAIKVGRQVTPAAEWLLDNIYLVDEQIRIAKRHLPKNYSRALPRLEERGAAGKPRVYDIALETIAHGDGRVDPEILSRFVSAYQQLATLKIGELWAIPIMLRLALIENLRRVAARLAETRRHRNLAHDWADAMLDVAEKNPAELILIVADMARSKPLLESSFVAELVRRLQGKSSALSLPLTWLSQRLTESGRSIDQLIQDESQRQAADQVSISNSIGSLRFLGEMDWRDFVETMSLVERTLREDPAGAYARMDFATRDRYRHAVEKIARAAQRDEREVAADAIALARYAFNDLGADDRRSHVGYYLVGAGRASLNAFLGHGRSWIATIRQTLARRPLGVYLASISALTLALAAGLMLMALQGGAAQWPLALIALFGLVLALPCSQLAQALVNWGATLLVTPQLLPRMDFSAGIPAAASTLVAVPSLLQSVMGAEHLVEALEVRFLANQDHCLRFCLLTDLGDADTQHLSTDAALLTAATRNIERLNKKYPRRGGDYFLLLHRPRSWNPVQNCWMGHERKRGKLGALNAFLLDGVTSGFSYIGGNIEGLAGTRYVITLDTDTSLPRDAGRQLVATMAHPLNRPVRDARRNVVVAGYGMLQPRITVSAPSVEASRFEMLYGGEVGIDPYTRAVSDIYQDLFGEGSFIGKGIYDVQVFEQVLAGRMPDNRILSHDLLEGCYARCALISDIHVNEQYPFRYSADVSRRHRWIRGDWQIAAWMMGRVPRQSAPGAMRSPQEKNPLSLLSRWKLFDNLRRSLVAPATTAMALVGWCLLDQAWQWTSAVLAVMFLQPFLSFLLDLCRWPPETSVAQHLAALRASIVTQLLHGLLAISLLPYEAWYHMDAIARTHWRLHVSHRRLLEWVGSTDIHLRSPNHLRAYYGAMWASPLMAFSVAIALVLMHPALLVYAAPILLLWWLAPYTVCQLSQPVARPQTELDDDQKSYLGTLSRKIWFFFETHVGPADNWLPPDNLQEHPVEALAHRTSPTNIGLALLANVSAYDFGYITQARLIERTRQTFQTMATLERYQGHFYNWYDTQDLRPLQPTYVSTVDSGNLAGHLLTLIPALEAVIDAKLLQPRLFDGLRDTVAVLDEWATDSARPVPTSLHQALQAALALAPDDAAGRREALTHLCWQAVDFRAQWQQLASAPDAVSDLAHALETQCHDALEQLDSLAPWIPMLVEGDWPAHILPLKPLLLAPLTLRHIAQLERAAHSVLAASPPQPGELQSQHLQPLLAQIRSASALATGHLRQIEMLMLQAAEFARMEYRFLHDPTTHLLAIGYDVTQHRRDAGSYDLLASEARLATFVAIAQGQLPQDSWFALGRQLTQAGGKPVLVSWSGSMFEYLMPLLVMPTFEDTLLNQTYHSVVDAQIAYGAQHGVFWGMSESGYHAFDASLNYQYRTFGIPGLGFKRGLADDLVVAPYASVMALMVSPQAACLNLQKMQAAGLEGKYGFYEAIDYTSARLPRGQDSVVVRSFMAHHQGMSLLSLAYVLLERPMQKYFASLPMFQATMSLLHERVPKAGSHFSASILSDVRAAPDNQNLPIRIISRPDPAVPEVQLLSNGRYHVMLTSAGSGYSRRGDLALTRWREDGTRDHWGSFCYVQEPGHAGFWSTTCQPVQAVPTHYEVIFSEGRAEFRRHDHDFEMHTEIMVSPEDDIELRRTKIANRSTVTRTLELTTYAEVVLAPAAADAMHQAFSNLFVQTEIDRQRGAILCTRRPRSALESVPWMFQLMAVHGAAVNSTSYETDRMAFLGRRNTLSDPAAMHRRGALSGASGSVLDPIMSIRHRITLAPEQSVICDLVMGVASTRESCLGLIDKYQDRHLADRVVELAWTHNQVVLRQLNASEADAQLYGRLANSVIYANPLLRADASILARNRRGQSALWSHAISGDLPIVLVQIHDLANLELVRQLVQAHAYWRSKGLAVDLVIWNEDHAGYRQVLQDQILGLISLVTGAHAIDRPGGIFLRMVEQIPEEDRILFLSVARVVLNDLNGTLADQVNRRDAPEPRLPMLLPQALPVDLVAPQRDALLLPGPAAHAAAAPLFNNGIGGFSADGTEYHIVTNADHPTPAPWCNVIANADFGTVVSESGAAYSWSGNAHEFRLTPWANDPVSDQSGETFYLRDEHSGQFWSPTPLPCAGSGDYLTRHGFGYSAFEHSEAGIFSELTVYVDLEAAVKYSVLRLRNDAPMARRLSATAYVEWVLGDLRGKTAMHITSELDPLTGALFASNRYNTEFPDRVAFFDVDADKSVTGDRCEFIGRNRSLADPVAMSRQRLSGRTGAGLDPCAAMRVMIDLAPQQERTLVFVMGVVDSRDGNPSSQVSHHRNSSTAAAALQAVHAYWRKTLGVIQVSSPDPAIDLLANGWLLYQTLACRMWARSGYYQSGGAFGFRDQLQDALALVHAEPPLARAHLLLCAAHQFVEGDVQHWWHPPTGRGVRTRCSDDYLWLPLAVCRYVSVTGDSAVLDEIAPFIEGRLVGADEDSYYDLPSPSTRSASLYEHCVAAIRHGLTFGRHGLSLMGSCDWNDGMDKVGDRGQGESVWLSFFLYEVLQRFAALAIQRGDTGFAATCGEQAILLQQNISANGWDGDWYLRAYFDDGSPLGAAANSECRIDSLSQSWAVLSGAGEPDRCQRAMAAVKTHLVRSDAKLIQLLDPPFDHAGQNPGYIRGYVPGVRENGGQYTHAAIWAVMAFARMGDATSAWQLMQMINPINHARTRQEVATYKVEPYVVAADVYAVLPHTGRGGWTWYTGSAGWMYRLLTESLLGLEVKANQLRINPCLPADWESYRLDYCYRGTPYRITIRQETTDLEPARPARYTLDGERQQHDCLTLVADAQVHHAEITLYRQAALSVV
ncbi:cyclic beta 1-2 glucan synthetase [Herbaspirillum seropedicae]|nr:cyclic beta 1-2 glucan synthetase [Herbaspirillum sp. alder98]